jgi:hypothetical protein
MREHKPTAENRAKVIWLACNGATQARIAQHLGVTEKTLRLHYRKEIDFGVESLLSRVLNNLASIACRGRGLPAVSAAKYLLSCRGGYKEHSVLGVEPTTEGLSTLMAACGVDEKAADIRARILARINAINGPDDSAREIIAGKLDALAARNRESNGDPKPSNCEAYKGPEDGE